MNEGERDHILSFKKLSGTDRLLILVLVAHCRQKLNDGDENILRIVLLELVCPLDFYLVRLLFDVIVRIYLLLLHGRQFARFHDQLGFIKY